MKAPQWLTRLGIPEACISQKSSVQEKSRRFSIRPQLGDSVWCVKLDGCWIHGDTARRIDYLFWVKNAKSKGIILLIELKGKNFGDALEQIRQTLERLCKNAQDQGIHTGLHRQSPGHDPVEGRGVRAYVILSRGGGVKQRLKDREYLRKKYGVRVVVYGQELVVNGVDRLP
ncbi:MAG: hypothetical protein EI684_10525 [Candidatus Viridilinea halotolerans]|uniref:Uncharacterized protein n=1 Tax=Candidatus Viridilinea halotolerans TaxID=2491704 RepID=A0A426U030_9CHLR|nr:MAG: hypothetical protein EI684_10525 [Candidatus Viridilinea halotolerans]